MKPKTLLLASLVSAALLLVGCGPPDPAYEKARAANTVAAYTEFLAAHPQSPYAQAARAAIEQLEWSATQAANTVDAYNAYLAKYPQGRFAGDAKEAVGNLEWASVATTSSGEVIDPEKDPLAALNLLERVIRDSSESDVRRVSAVHGLGQRMLGVTRSNVSDSTRIVAGVYTVGMSELLVVPLMGRHTLVPNDQLPQVGDLFVELLDDPSKDVRDASTVVVQQSSMRITSSLIKGCAGKPGARRVVVPQLARDVIYHVKTFNSQLPNLTIATTDAIMPCLENATHDADPELQRIGVESLAAARAAFDDWADKVARSTNSRDLAIGQNMFDAAGFGFALQKATPKFRKRLADPDFNIRLGAAHVVVCAEHSAYPAIAELAANLWTGIQVNALATEAQDSQLASLSARLKLAKYVDSLALADIEDLGPLAAPAVPLIVDMIRAGDADTREYELASTIDSLIWIGPAASSAASDLTPFLESKSSRIQTAAAIALAHLTADPRATPVLQRAVGSRFALNQEDAAVAMLLVDPHNASALQLLALPPDFKVPLVTLLTAEVLRTSTGTTERMRAVIRILLIRAGTPTARRADDPAGAVEDI